MKRILIIFLVICLMGALAAGCTGGDRPMPPDGYAQVNFNNTLLIRPDFYFFDEGCFYALDGFYNMGVYRSRGGKPEKKRKFCLYGAVWAAGGAVLTGIAWLISALI